MADTLADIDAVFQWLLRRGVRRQRIVLYGQSLGSGPTLELAAREPALAGVILHAAFASGLRPWSWLSSRMQYMHACTAYPAHAAHSHVLTFAEYTCAPGLRQLRPGGKYFPSWFDIYPNSERIQQVAAPVLIVHVRPHSMCCCPCIPL